MAGSRILVGPAGSPGARVPSGEPGAAESASRA